MAVRWIPGTELASIEIDPNQLYQILSNLLVNAADAIQDNGTIIVTTTTVPSESVPQQELSRGRFAAITVEDDDRGCRRRPGRGSSSRSSPPSRPARAGGATHR